MDKELMTKLARLENKIRQLRDEQVKQRRLNEDMMFNLDDDNFSSSYKVEQGNKFAQLKMTADEISAKVGNLSGSVSSLSIKANNISSTVTKIYGEAKHSDAMPNYSFDTDVMYEYNGTYYYYNDVTSRWTPVSENSVVSKIIQTKDGFQLSGDVKLDGNVFVNGTFETSMDDSGYSAEIKVLDKTAMFNIRNAVDDMPLFSIMRAGLADRSIGDDRVLIFASFDYNAYIDFLGKVNFGSADVYGLYAVFA